MTKKKLEKQERYDNHNDPSGRVLFRTWLYSGDREGKDLRFDALGAGVVRTNETKSYAPGPTVETPAEQRRAERQALHDKALAKMTPLELAVFVRQGKLKTREWVTLIIAAGDLVAYQREGYTFVPGSAHERPTPNGTVQCVEVKGQEYVETKRLNHTEIAAELGVSVYQVQRAVTSGNKKLRGLDG